MDYSVQPSALEIVSELEGWLDYVIGERGKCLSEGHEQRIAIAIDLLTEKKNPNNFLDLIPNRMVIISTHRTVEH